MPKKPLEERVNAKMRALGEALNGKTAAPKQPHVVIHVNGGCVDYTESKDVRVFFFDWDNLEESTELEFIDGHIADAEDMPNGQDKRDTIERLQEFRDALVRQAEEAKKAEAKKQARRAALAAGGVNAAQDALSDLLEDPGAENDDIREAAVQMCEALNEERAKKKK